MRRSCGFTAVVLLTIASVVVAVESHSPDDRPPPTEAMIDRSFQAGAYARAARQIEQWIEARGDHPVMLYNLACAYSRIDRIDDASSALFRAVEAGFLDFDHMERDPDLAALRGDEVYRAILEAARKTTRRRSRDALEEWRHAFGETAYRYESDEARRIAYATALDDRSHREMREMIEREADHLVETLFGAPPERTVLIAVPTPDDATAVLGPDEQIGGRYEHGRRRLVARNIGGSLRHEFVHALHYAHMERLGLDEAHPIWIQEGLASLYEHYDLLPDGTITFLPNERTNVANRLARGGRLTPWKTLFALDAEQFMEDAGRLYPQTRAIFEYLAARDRLEAWYRAYVEGGDGDMTGAAAFEAVFGRPAAEVEREWRAWVRQRPMIDMRIDSGDASLGIVTRTNMRNDGVLVERVLPGSSAQRGRLRRGDVIVSIDGVSTRSLLDLHRVIGAKRVGDRVTIRARRKDRYLTTATRLRPLRRTIR